MGLEEHYATVSRATARQRSAALRLPGRNHSLFGKNSLMRPAKD